MPNLDATTALRITRLGAKARAITVELASNPALEEKKPSTIGRIAKGTAIAAGLGGLGYAGASYARGRKLMSPVGVKGHLDVLRAGSAANLADIGKLGRTAGAKLNVAGKSAMAKAEELRRKAATKVGSVRNAAARAAATTPIQSTYAVD